MNRMIGVIGAGRFGRAFIQGILKSGLYRADQVWASARTQINLDAIQNLGVRATKEFQGELAKTDTLVIAVKPAQISDVIEKLNQANLSDKTLIISVAAGTSIEKIEKTLKTPNPIVRAMPNSPCTVQRGFTSICRGSHASDTDLQKAKRIFETLGQCFEIEEKYFDMVTALSGSGPAYFYQFMEVMIEVGVRAGLDREACIALVAQTASGAAEMVLSQGRSPADLKKDVATPGGCTIEALKILDSNQISNVFASAIEEAARVAGRLGKN